MKDYDWVSWLVMRCTSQSGLTPNKVHMEETFARKNSNQHMS